MKAIAVTVLVCAAAAFAAHTAVADDAAPQNYQQVSTTQIRKDLTLRPPPIVLPDIRGRTWKLSRADRQWLAPQLKKSRQVVAFFNNPKYRWVIAPRKDKCWEVPWQRQCTVARAKMRLHHALAELAERRLWRELPNTYDWKTAVGIAQRVYPGTGSWLWSCSAAEGSHGRWVWYGSHPWRGYHIGDDFLGMDTVGGWMQFRFSTFNPYWRQAKADVERKGFVIPELNRYDAGRYEPWLSPVAQALTAGYMRFYGKDGHHWSASHGNGC